MMEEKTKALFTAALAVIVADSKAYSMSDYRAHRDFEELRRSIAALASAARPFYLD